MYQLELFLTVVKVQLWSIYESKFHQDSQAANEHDFVTFCYWSMILSCILGDSACSLLWFLWLDSWIFIYYCYCIMLINFNVTCQNYFITSVINIYDFYTILSLLECLESDVANLKYLYTNSTATWSQSKLILSLLKKLDNINKQFYKVFFLLQHIFVDIYLRVKFSIDQLKTLLTNEIIHKKNNRNLWHWMTYFFCSLHEIWQKKLTT